MSVWFDGAEVESKLINNLLIELCIDNKSSSVKIRNRPTAGDLASRSEDDRIEVRDDYNTLLFGKLSNQIEQEKEMSYYQNKTVLITGAASGIGKRLAEVLAERFDVRLILWDRNPDTLRENREVLPDGVEVRSTGVDVSDKEQIDEEAQKVIEAGWTPDIIVNCAGIVVGKFFHEHSYDDIERTMQINSTGSMWVVRAFINPMIERGSGHVVNLASASGYIGNPRMSIYASSKWAVLGLTESLRVEMKQLGTGVNVTSVIPSYIKTGMFDGVRAPLLVPLLETDDIVEKMISGIAKQKNKIQAPFMVRTVPLLKAVLPAPIFDWVAGNLLGVYRSMDTFKGRNKE